MRSPDVERLVQPGGMYNTSILNPDGSISANSTSNINVEYAGMVSEIKWILFCEGTNQSAFHNGRRI